MRQHGLKLHWFGFVPLPANVLGALALVTALYLIAVYRVKRWFLHATS